MGFVYIWGVYGLCVDKSDCIISVRNWLTVRVRNWLTPRRYTKIVVYRLFRWMVGVGFLMLGE